MKWILSIIIVMVLSISAYCEVLPDGSKFNLYNDFTGGLNTRDPPHKLQQNESPFIRNCLIDEGEIDPPAGTSILGSTSTLQKINLFKRYVKDDGTVEFIVSDSSIVLKTQDFSVYTLLKSGLNGSYRLRAKQVESKMYFTNGSDSPFTYNGTTVTVLDGGTYNLGKTPNMPKFKYLEYFQNRLWGFNLPSNSSVLQWHLFQSTDVIPIAYAPDHELAWSNSNLQLNIDKGNGTVGTFLRVYAGQLFAGKERGIHYIYGNDDTNYAPVPIVKDYGFLSDESVVEQDNVLLGYGNDGIYEFNGQQMTRISDKIFPDILVINSGINRNITITWDSKNDFGRGYFSGTTATVGGLVTIEVSTYVLVSTIPSQVTGKSVSNKYTPFLLNLSTSTGWVSITTNTIDSSKLLQVSTRAFPTYLTASAGLSFMTTTPNNDTKPTSNCKITIKNLRTGVTAYAESPSIVTTGDGFSNIDITFTEASGINNLIFTPNDIVVGNFQLRIEQPDGCVAGSPNCEFDLMFTSHAANIYLKDANVGQYLSDIATVTAITAWGNLNSVFNNNFGNVQFYYRTSTSAINLSTGSAWIPIVSGGVIGSSITNTYIQYGATLTINFGSDSPNIDNVKIIYQTGGGSDINPFGQSWRNSYYLFVTTTTTGLTNLCYVKSRSGTKNPYGWSVLEGINIKSSLSTSDVWYLGSSTAGVAMRGDYGTNYNGNAINQIYETNDNNFEQPFINKNILEYGLDTDYVASSTYTLFTSIDRGAYASQDINNSGSGRMIRRLSYPFAKGNSFKFKFVNSQLDKQMKIYNFIAYFKENATRTNTP